MTIQITGVSMAGGAYILSDTMIPSQVVFNSPGTFTWTCPEGITLVSVICVGGGGSGNHGMNNGNYFGSSGGGGGGLGYKNNISVVPGMTYTVVVGAGGYDSGTGYNGDGTSGTDSYFISPYLVKGAGGTGAVGNTPGVGGTYVGDGGGNGGNGGATSGSFSAAGGGGAGGYTGNGGNGGNGSTSPTAGAGGAGGGGAGGNSYAAGGGGGVGLYGIGSNGIIGASNNGGGRGGSYPVTNDGSDGSGTISSLGGNGGWPGGGGGGAVYQVSNAKGGNGAFGAVRIIWGTTGGVRRFPSPTYGTIDQSASTIAPSSDATLSGLIFSTGALTPTFSNGTTNYTQQLNSLTSSVTVTPTVNNQYATVKVNGVTVNSGSASGSISLGGLGNNTTITIVITAQDLLTTKTYTTVVTNYAGSTINTLSGLTLSSGTLSPAFNSGTTSYTATVTNATGSINVTPTATDATSTIVVNGNGASASGSPVTVNLSYGSNTLNVYVTSQSGVTNTYTTTVTRTLSSDASLATLYINNDTTGVAQTLTPTFASATTSYTVAQQIWDNGQGARTFSYWYTTSSPLATVEFMDQWYSTSYSLQSDRGGGSYLSGAYLINGPNMNYIRVTAQDGTVKIYQFSVFKQSQGQVAVGYGSSYPTPGLYTYTVDPGITSVSVICVGGGGGGGSRPSITGVNYGGGGGGGGLRYINNYAVTAGQVINVFVGAGGAPGVAGTASYFNTAAVVSGGGGGNGTYATSGTATGGAGGAGVGTGFNGGAGGASTNTSYNGGGGGAGGYSAAGGAGGTGGSNGGTGVTGGGGGGGGSSYGVNSGNYTIGGSGGGVGLYGKTTGGSPGIGGNTSGYAYHATGGGGGSGGATGDGQPSATGYQSSAYAGGAGGGGGGGTHGGYGGDGAIRIVWPGLYRQFNSSTGTNISTDI